MVCKIKTLLIGLAILSVVQAASITISANSDLLTRSDAIIGDIRRRIIVLLEDLDVINRGVAKVLSRREDAQNLNQNSTTTEPNEKQAQPVESLVQPPKQPPAQSHVKPSVQVQRPIQYPPQRPPFPSYG